MKSHAYFRKLAPTYPQQFGLWYPPSQVLNEDPDVINQDKTDSKLVMGDNGLFFVSFFLGQMFSSLINPHQRQHKVFLKAT